MKFCLLDVSNLVHRAKHVVASTTTKSVSQYGTLEEDEAIFDEKVGMILHIVFQSMRRAHERFQAKHCVACFDSRSWRKDFYPEYKANRQRDVTPQDEAERKLINKTMDEFRVYLENHTNVTVLHADGIEADDFIARWLFHQEENPDAKHVICSADSDFRQLVRPGVELYSPINTTLYRHDGVFFQDGKRPGKGEPTLNLYGETWKVKLDKKTGKPEQFDPLWELFKKCIRGDSSDNIPSAYPRVQETRMRKAFEGSSLEWNSFINSTWGDSDNPVRVIDRFEFNTRLIDLTAQPENIIEIMDEAILKALDKPHRSMVGMHFMKFCQTYGLMDIQNQAPAISSLLNTSWS